MVGAALALCIFLQQIPGQGHPWSCSWVGVKVTEPWELRVWGLGLHLSEENNDVMIRDVCEGLGKAQDQPLYYGRGL